MSTALSLRYRTQGFVAVPRDLLAAIYLQLAAEVAHPLAPQVPLCVVCKAPIPDFKRRSRQYCSSRCIMRAKRAPQASKS